MIFETVLSFKILIFVIIFILIIVVQKIWQNRHPDVGLNAKQLIQRYGYLFENHTVQTEDGYILEIHRIPPTAKKNVCNRPPILIMAGLWCNSADWVNMGENSLGFVLSNKGYDVWLGNYRGTTWSKKHTNLDCKKDKKKFFDYSFQEIGHYDVPACIDYILNVTKQKDLFYIGHSLGTVVYFILMSDKPNYKEKIRLTIALSPGAAVQNPKSYISKFVLKAQHIIGFVVKKTNCCEVMAKSNCLPLITQVLCHEFSPFKYACAYVFYLIAGFSTQLNMAKIPVIVSNCPAGSSYKLLEHFFQLQNNGHFGKYDYGKVENVKRYGQPTPPEYDLSKSKAPIAVFYGSNDALVSPRNVRNLISRLPNVVMDKLILGFNHLDVMWGIDAEELIFRDIVKIIKGYS